jgi:hypothetical protein
MPWLDDQIKAITGESHWSTPPKSSIKSLHQTFFTVTLPAAGWQSSGGVFTQTVTAPEATEEMTPVADVQLSDDHTIAAQQIYAWNLIGRITTGNGTVRFLCYGAKPEVNLTVKLRG